MYKEGTILATQHVDRLLLVSSAINVDQDVGEPWYVAAFSECLDCVVAANVHYSPLRDVSFTRPLEVIGHDGIARNVTMLPGDMVLYESHSVLHGRPFPLKGRFMANVFIHFEPIQEIGGQMEYTGELPPYLIPGSPEEANWRRGNPNGHKLMGSEQNFATGSTEAHHHALRGDLEKLKETLDKHADLVNVRDKNGWTPLHEAVRYGDEEMVRFLLDRGAEMNARIGARQEGGSALWLAKKFHGEGHSIAALLESRGAKHHNPNAEL